MTSLIWYILFTRQRWRSGSSSRSRLHGWGRSTSTGGFLSPGLLGICVTRRGAWRRKNMGRGTRGTGLLVGVRSGVLRLGGGKVKGRIPSGGRIGYAVAGERFPQSSVAAWVSSTLTRVRTMTDVWTLLVLVSRMEPVACCSRCDRLPRLVLRLARTVPCLTLPYLQCGLRYQFWLCRWRICLFLLLIQHSVFQTCFRTSATVLH